MFAIWAPLKDLETFDALLRGLEALEPPSLARGGGAPAARCSTL